MSPAERDSLERLLHAHEPADAFERESLDRIRVFVGEHADPFDRRLRHGHLVGSAFVIDPHGRLLLTWHRRLGLWLQLGGHAEREHSAQDVALREAREESGLGDLGFHPYLALSSGEPRLLDVDVHTIPARAEEPAHLHHDLRFLLLTRTPEAISADPAETRALEWLPLSQARKRCEAGMGRALSKIEALLGGTGTSYLAYHKTETLGI